MSFEQYEIKPLAKARDIYSQISIKEKYKIDHQEIIMICKVVINETIGFAKDEHQEYLSEVRNCLDNI